MQLPRIHTRNGVTVFINGDSHEIDANHRYFPDIIEILKTNPEDADVQITDLLTRNERVVKAGIAAAPANSGVTFEDGTVKWNGRELHNTLTNRLLQMLNEGFDVEPLVNFLTKLMSNPSFRVVNSLYDFLEHGRIPITEDGDFLAYKAIRQDWTDIHSGTFDNSVGTVVRIERNQVDEDANRTCSHGLHVCSWDYLPHFSHNNGRVVIVKVNPADVVAIPADYNNTKMRCAGYEVVSEYLDYYTKDPHNLLADRSVFNSSQFSDEVEEEYDDEVSDFYDDWGNN